MAVGATPIADPALARTWNRTVAILAQIKAKEAAIERYHLAFENGTMDDATAGERLKVLRGEIAQLTARAADLADAMGSEPAAPPPGTIERLHTYLADTIASGTPAERKAAIEALVAEVRITEEGVIPVFRIPAPRTPVPGGHGTTIAGTEPVRAMVWSVRSSRLGLTWADGLWLMGCPQVKRPVPTFVLAA